MKLIFVFKRPTMIYQDKLGETGRASNVTTNMKMYLITQRVHQWRTLSALTILTGVFLFTSTALGAPRSARPIKEIARKSPVKAIASSNCLMDSACDDSTDCTIDRCVDGLCIHDAVPGCVACTQQFACPPIDVVFVMDTSGSMRDEAAALCSDMGTVITDLAALGVIVRPIFLGITEIDDGPFSCLVDDVVNLLGPTVPGTGDTCDFPTPTSSFESWGPATAIVAQQFAWNANARRIIIPISDEGPCNGSYPDGCNNPGDDRDSIDNAIAIANLNNVTVMPILGTGADACATTLAQALAAGTNGTSYQTTDPLVDLADAIFDMLLAMCDSTSPCNDGDVCTAMDSCSDNGVCTGIDVSTVACQSDTDCLTGSVCDMNTNQCVCQLMPDLCLEPELSTQTSGGCYEIGDEIIVRIEVGISATPISGGQFFISYDPAVLDFISIESGAADDPASPFSNVLSTIIDETAGTVFYAVGTQFNQLGTHGPEILAALHFNAIQSCSSTDLCFLDQNPKLTILTDATASRVPYTPCCINGLFIADAPPTMACPESVVTDADAGRRAATVSWNTPMATDSCNGTTQLSCTASTDTGVPVSALIAQGGLFAIGHSSFECVATNDCGQSSTCQWSIDVNDAATVEVDVQIAPPIANGPLNRCIEFVFYSTCANAPVVVQQELTFGFPFNFAGQAVNVPVTIPAGSYTCVTARDPLHTLLSTTLMQIENNIFVASFTGDPLIGGNWLIPGNLDGNDVIDMLDLFTLFQVWAPPEITTLAPNSACGLNGSHPDLNGDGFVDAFDEAIIQANMLAISSVACCDTSSTGSAAAATTSITIKQLRQEGYGTLLYLDANGDGQIEFNDITTIITQGRPSRLKSGSASRSR